MRINFHSIKWHICSTLLLQFEEPIPFFLSIFNDNFNLFFENVMQLYKYFNHIYHCYLFPTPLSLPVSLPTICPLLYFYWQTSESNGCYPHAYGYRASGGAQATFQKLVSTHYFVSKLLSTGLYEFWWYANSIFYKQKKVLLCSMC